MYVKRTFSVRVHFFEATVFMRKRLYFAEPKFRHKPQNTVFFFISAFSPFFDGKSGFGVFITL